MGRAMDNVGKREREGWREEEEEREIRKMEKESNPYELLLITASHPLLMPLAWRRKHLPTKITITFSFLTRISVGLSSNEMAQ